MRAEFSLTPLFYDLRRVLNILGTAKLLATEHERKRRQFEWLLKNAVVPTASGFS